MINNRTAPAYKLARYLINTLDQHISLNNNFSVTNSSNLSNDRKIEIHENHRMTSFVVKDIYVNIPIDETLKNNKN